jgi:PAS domain S-box-containing protein
VYAEIITERKRREEALRQSEENYRTLFDSSTDGIFLLDLEGRFIDANRTAHERLGYTREEFLALSIRQLDAPAFASRVPERLRQIREKGVAVFESGHLRKDGSTMPVEVNSRLLEYKGTTVFFSVIRDISERKRAEELLRASEEFNRDILDTVDEGFIVVDRDFRILTANRAYCDQVGATCDDVTGKHCYEVSHRTDRPCHEAGEECAVQKVLASGKQHTALHRHPDAQGQMMFVETKAYPILDAAGRVASVIETITNVTERKLLEEERLKTQKLESIGTLAGGIAHDFNNLLQGVFGYISMAKMPLDRVDRSFAMLEQAEKALHLSVNLTNQLLTFSKGGKPVKKRVALGPVIENAARFALSGSRSVCRLEIDPGLWETDADEGQIAQVIQNVVLNADQAMPLGGTVTVTARNLAAAEAVAHPGLGPRDHVEIAVRDEGVGIPAQYLDKIFDPYFTTKEKGSGLGLATSYSIVKNHDGKIEVESAPGSGTSFTIYLPGVAAAAPTAVGPEVPAGTRTGRILVMDDDELVRTIAGQLLAALGHEVVQAERGETALEEYQSAREAGRPFDIVILDLTIRGGMGGAETMRRLLEIDAGVKAVVSSGYSDDEVTSAFREHGFRAFLKKPYRLEELKATLTALLA